MPMRTAHGQKPGSKAALLKMDALLLAVSHIVEIEICSRYVITFYTPQSGPQTARGTVKP